MKMDVKACIKKEVIRLSNKEKISPEDATIIDSIKILFNHGL